MAKKNEFRPDKPRAGLLSKLYLTQKQRKSLLKWFLYATVLLVLSIVQDVILCNLRPLGATSELVPCGIFLICVLEGLENGSVFALVAALCYNFSGSSDGVYSIVLITALSVGVTFFRQSYLQKGFGAAVLCVTAAMVVYELSMYGLALFLGLTTAGRILAFFLKAVLSLLAVPVLYPVCLSIGKIGGESWKE
jgi:hypothetical protein